MSKQAVTCEDYDILLAAERARNQQAIGELLEEVARLREALKKYGDHGSHCFGLLGNDEVNMPCSCGFDKAVEG